jgi:hypothetical protein
MNGNVSAEALALWDARPRAEKTIQRAHRSFSAPDVGSGELSDVCVEGGELAALSSQTRRSSFGRVVPSFAAPVVHHWEAERFMRKAIGTVGSSSLGLAIYSLR